MAVITTACERFDCLVVVVAGNSQKRTGLFTVDERVALLSDACRSLSNVTVASRDGLLVDIAREVGVDVLVRSAGKEHPDEKGMAYESILISPLSKTSRIWANRPSRAGSLAGVLA
jgi:phosphopantetheine adenylyltransferase